MVRLVLRGGIGEVVRSYVIDGGRVRFDRLDGSTGEVACAEVDAEATFAANASAGKDAKADDPPLELLSRDVSERAGYRIVEGAVRNCGPGELSGLVARVVAQDREGRLLGAEEALIDPARLSPGGEGTFRVILRAPGIVGRLDLRFRSLRGEAVGCAGVSSDREADEVIPPGEA